MGIGMTTYNEDYLASVKMALKDQHKKIVLDNMSGPADINGGKYLLAMALKLDFTEDARHIADTLAKGMGDKLNAIAFYEFSTAGADHFYIRYAVVSLP
jgi:hypothetical protein